MSIPPEPPEPPEPPDQPPDEATTRSKHERRTGAVVATVAVFLISVVPLVGGMFLGSGFLFGPGAALLCVLLGSVLTIFEPTRQFAVGFLIASAILILVTAGICVAMFAVFASNLALGLG